GGKRGMIGGGWGFTDPVHQVGDELSWGGDGAGILVDLRDGEMGEEAAEVAPERGRGDGAAGVIGGGAGEDNLLRGASEGDIAEEIFVEKAALAVGFDVDVALAEIFSLRVGEDGIFAGAAGELTFVHAEEDGDFDARAAGAVDLADEDLVERRRG